MSGRKGRLFTCGVVNEDVQIHLTTRRVGGFFGEERPFVQCDQLECQYVDDNADPCPLRLEMFAEELREREERARLRREEDEY